MAKQSLSSEAWSRVVLSSTNTMTSLSLQDTGAKYCTLPDDLRVYTPTLDVVVPLSGFAESCPKKLMVAFAYIHDLYISVYGSKIMIGTFL